MNRLFDVLNIWLKNRLLKSACTILLWPVLSLPIEAQPLACNDLVHLSLDSNCTGVVTAGMLLEDMTGSPTDYTISLFYGNGSLQPDLNFNFSDVGQIYTFSVVHIASGNKCWGRIKIEDKYPPYILCQNDTIRCGESISPWALGFPIPSWITASILENPNVPRSYTVNGWDACGHVMLKYTDMTSVEHCADTFFKKIVRSWEATDINGNKATCDQLICVYTPSEIDIVPPPNFDGFDRDPIPCNFQYPRLPNGNPSPAYTGWPVPPSCSTLNAAYADIRIQVCSGTFKVVRKWTVLNWCSQNITEFYQIIKVLDDQHPEIVCPEDYTIGMDPYSCTGTVKLGGLVSVKDCSNYTWEPFTRLVEGGPLVKDYIYYDPKTKSYYLKDAPEGRIWVAYVVTDDCGNVSECFIEIGVFDDISPIAVCDQKTAVSLGIDGTAKVYALNLDDGSLDNCGVANFRARRMDDSCGNRTHVFGPYVEFCCKDVGSTKMVTVEVTDFSGNKNTCMVEVVVQEKEPPFIEAPSDITVSCGFNVHNLEQFGKIVFNERDREEIIIRDPLYSNRRFVAGIDGYAYDNCHVTVTERFEKYLNCGVGFVLRFFTAVDRQGLSTTDVQTITVINPNPITRSDIRFPRDTTINSCSNVVIHPNATGRPIVDPRKTACAQIASQYEDLLLTTLDSVCYKIIRKWTVIDWCQYNVDYNTGYWEAVQLIYVKNSEPPVLESCADTVFCDQAAFYDQRANKCFGSFRLQGIADDDCTKPNDLSWQYRIDYFNDGTYDTLRNGRIATGVLPLGIHRLRWYVQDQCGNNSVCDQVFTIKDCKKPTPYCANGIVTVLMETNRQVTVWASDLNLNSFDNCTQAAHLIFSFSQDTLHKSITFTCDSLKGRKTLDQRVRIYVTDEAGNQDYCETFIRIQDNGACSPTGNLNLSGTVKRADQSSVTGVNLLLDNENGESIAKTEVDELGSYAFQQIPPANYTIRASKNDDIINGLSTLDLLLIQKHILDVKKLSSPYILLAADVNASKSITARDIAELRKAILGHITQFEQKPIWQFVPAYHRFSDPSTPWDCPKYMQTKHLEDVYDQADWVAIKTGDVNLSAITGSMYKMESRSKNAVYLVIDEVDSENAKRKFAVKAASAFDMEGMQFSMMLPKHASVRMISAKCDISNDCYSVKGDQLRVSYISTELVRVLANDILFYLELSGYAKAESFDFQLTSSLSNEVYVGKAMDVAPLEISQNPKYAVHGLQVFGPRPNPFTDQCTVPFSVPADAEIRIKILDHTGKEIHQSSINATKGMQQCEFTRHMFGSSGLYYIMLESAHGNVIVKTMLIE